MTTTANENCSTAADANLQEQLAQACSKGDLDSLKVLVSKGADPNLPCGDKTFAILEAARNGEVSVVRALLEAGSRTQLTANDKQEVLSTACIAAAGGWVQILEVLHENDPSSISEGEKKGSGNQPWVTPLHQAALHRQSACLQFLLRHHALWYVPETYPPFPTTFCTPSPLCPPALPDPAINPVCAAAKTGSMADVKLLLNAGGNMHGVAGVFALQGRAAEMKEILEMCPQEMELMEAAGALTKAVEGRHTDLVISLLESYPIHQIITPEALATVGGSECNSELWSGCVNAALRLRDPVLCYRALLAAVTEYVQPEVVFALLAAGAKPDQAVWKAAIRSRYCPGKAGVLRALKEHMGSDCG